MSLVEWLLLGIAAAFTLVVVPALIAFVVGLFRSNRSTRARRSVGKRR